MPNGPDTSGYDPIVGIQPANPTDVMAFSMLQRPVEGQAYGPPTEWIRVPFKIIITDFKFTYWNGSEWAAIGGSEMPFTVDPNIVGTGGQIAGTKQFVISLEPNTNYSGPFPACIEVGFESTGPKAKSVKHMGRAVRFT